MDISTFHKNFKELTNPEQVVLKMLSVAYEGVKRDELAGWLEALSVRRENGSNIRELHLRDMQEMLYEGGWLVSSLTTTMELKLEYRELAMRMAVIDPRFPHFVQMIRRTRPYRSYGRVPGGFDLVIREMRIALYEGNSDKFREHLVDALHYYPERYEQTDFFGNFFSPFDADWLLTFPPAIQELATTSLLDRAMKELEPARPFIEFIRENNLPHTGGPKGDGDSPLTLSLASRLALRGEVEKLAKFVGEVAAAKGQGSTEKINLEGLLAFFQGNHQLAIYHWENVLKLTQKTAERGAGLPGLSGALLPLAALKIGGKDALKKVEKYTGLPTDMLNDRLVHYLRAVIFHQQNDSAAAHNCLTEKPHSALEWLFYALASYWTEQPLSPAEMETIRQLFAKAKANEYEWLAMELASITAKIDNVYSISEYAKQTSLRLGILPLTGYVQRTERWERSLDALLALQPRRTRNTSTGTKVTRLAWLVDFAKQKLQPIEQTNSGGLWSKGRNVALKRLKDGSVNNMTDQDRRAAKAVKQEPKSYYGSGDFYIDFAPAIEALIGHPLLFLEENREVAVELVEQQPQLMVEEKEGQFELRFSQPIHTEGIQIIRETPTRYIALNVSGLHLEIDKLIGQGGLQVPTEAKGKLVEAVGKLSSMVTVQSAIGGEAVEVVTVEANATPHLHLLPIGEGFKIEFFVKPFSSAPPYFKPGVGQENIIAEIDGAPTRAIRSLRSEKTKAKRVVSACPTLLRTLNEGLEWHFENVEDCLTVMLELEPLRASKEVVMEYPKGEKLRISGSIGFDQLSIGIKKERNWFAMDGQVQVNENLVMNFRELLELTQNASGNFVKVSDGEFIALTSQLRRKLDDLNAILSPHGADLGFHPLAAPMLEGFTDLLHDLKVDSAWQSTLTRLRDAKEVKPDVPAGFGAELRNYQLDGFRWLSQLAYWGVGACLADDMGLGKTVQALAVILDRANAGPALVVAPASVVRNWRAEAEKFTPRLRPLVFGEGDRDEMMDDLQPFDLLLMSYGLMQQESGRLAAEHFTTIVLDEAQAIKNRSTKRSQAAMQLQGDFKVITTGTPIENHLGELWNLFNFLNPGLLGSIGRFNENFGVPIEKLNDKERRNQLRRLIQPFILRRRKDDVLKELPPKTEVTLTVELSDEERAFYEALRRRAVENLGQQNGQAGEQRFKILAELMRLRQACCHPRLVEPGSQLPSSKLQLFAETVEEVLSEGHKVLVFSQFVRHLKLVEEWVNEKGITYQYLDGSTPMNQRERAINAFQDGEGDLFLISLKAGGFGLNLTAADYVIHLDPWWNPAVEDQASDRAHRIGQERPVTIYRLVAENTIEEKIVKLHAEKRDLADSLLEGTQASARMSAEELLDLMKG